MSGTDTRNEDYLAIREHWDFSEEASKLRSLSSRFNSAVPSPTNIWSENFQVAPADSVNEEKKEEKLEAVQPLETVRSRGDVELSIDTAVRNEQHDSSMGVDEELESSVMSVIQNDNSVSCEHMLELQRQNDLIKAYNDVCGSSGASSRRQKWVEYVVRRNVMSLLLDRVSEEIDKRDQKIERGDNACLNHRRFLSNGKIFEPKKSFLSVLPTDEGFESAKKISNLHKKSSANLPLENIITFPRWIDDTDLDRFRSNKALIRKMQSWSNFCKVTYHDKMFSVDRSMHIEGNDLEKIAIVEQDMKTMFVGSMKRLLHRKLLKEYWNDDNNRQYIVKVYDLPKSIHSKVTLVRNALKFQSDQIERTLSDRECSLVISDECDRFYIRGTEETNVNFVEKYFCFHFQTLLSLTSEETFENDMYDSGLVAERIIDNSRESKFRRSQSVQVNDRQPKSVPHTMASTSKECANFVNFRTSSHDSGKTLFSDSDRISASFTRSKSMPRNASVETRHEFKRSRSVGRSKKASSCAVKSIQNNDIPPSFRKETSIGFGEQHNAAYYDNSDSKNALTELKSLEETKSAFVRSQSTSRFPKANKKNSLDDCDSWNETSWKSSSNGVRSNRMASVRSKEHDRKLQTVYKSCERIHSTPRRRHGDEDSACLSYSLNRNVYSGKFPAKHNRRRARSKSRTREITTNTGQKVLEKKRGFTRGRSTVRFTEKSTSAKSRTSREKSGDETPDNENNFLSEHDETSRTTKEINRNSYLSRIRRSRSKSRGRNAKRSSSLSRKRRDNRFSENVYSASPRKGTDFSRPLDQFSTSNKKVRAREPISHCIDLNSFE